MKESKGKGSAFRLSYPKESNKDSCTLGQAIKDDKADIVFKFSLSFVCFRRVSGAKLPDYARFRFGWAADYYKIK
jgi:hypothetical protein